MVILRLMHRKVVFLLLNVFSSMVFADASVQLNINPNTLEVGDRFTVGVEVREDRSDETISVEQPTAPQVPGARLVNQWVSQRVNSSTVVNAQGETEFKTLQTQIFNYQYEALKDGDLVVPAITINAGGKNIKTATGRVKVYAQGAGGRPRVQQQRPQVDPFGMPDDDFMGGNPFEQLQKMEEQFNQLLQRRYGQNGANGFQAIPDFDAKDAFFIVAEVDKTEAYEGEQIRATWYLYTKSGVREIDTLKYPDLKGFWKEDIELATLLNFRRDTLNGQPYNKALLASYALFPLEAGKAVIDAYKAKVGVVTGFGRAITETKASKDIPVLIKPLPTEGRPEHFSGAVGVYKISAQIEEGTTVVAHQPFVVKIRLEGQGNAKEFDLPDLNLPPSVEVYDVKNDAKFFKSGMSYKEFEVYLIPREAGELTLPKITTSFFEPQSATYKTISTDEIKLNVLAGSGQQGMTASRIKNQESAAQPLSLITQWEPKNYNPQPNLWLWLSLYIIAIIGFLTFAAIKLGWFRPSKTLKDHMQERLKKAKLYQQQQEWRQLGIEVTNLVYYVLGEVSGQGGADVELKKLLEKCPPSVRREVGDDLRKNLDKFYLLGFGPDSAVDSTLRSGGTQEPLKKVEKLLSRVIELSQEV